MDLLLKVERPQNAYFDSIAPSLSVAAIGIPWDPALDGVFVRAILAQLKQITPK